MQQYCVPPGKHALHHKRITFYACALDGCTWWPYPGKDYTFSEKVWVVSVISQNFRNFRNFGNFPGVFGISEVCGISPEFWGENSGFFSWFQAVIVCKHLQNGRFSGDDFLGFPEFPEISGNFPKMSGIFPEFRGENSGVFSGFPAVIVYNHLQNGRFSGDDFRDFPEVPEIPENFRNIPEFRNFGNPKNSRNFRKFPATGFFQNFLYFFIIYALWRLVHDYKKL